MFAFRNGIYDVRSGQLQPFDEVCTSDVCANFFDFEVDVHQHLTLCPTLLPTPVFDSILTDQHLCERAVYWIHALCGRLLHDVGAMDDWQVCLYIRGVAGSGKSSILNTVEMFYESVDIGTLMSDGQETFSDEHLYDKFMVVAKDVDNRMHLNKSRFNSFVSGETVSINRKFKTALQYKWRAPMVMASNSQPPFEDVAGNVVRRFAICLFDYKPPRSDTDMSRKLRNELPMLLLKMSRTYLDALRCHGHQSLWDPDVLPSIFHNAKKQYLVTTSPLSAFMESDQVQLDAASEVSSSDFRRALAQWVRENGDRRTGPIAMISKVDHGHLFSMYGCNIEDRACGSACKTVIRGLKLISV